MKVSYNWLKEFVNLPIGPEDLAERLLLLGFEVTSIERLGASFEGVVVGQILEIQKHPNADRLTLCRVTDGSNEALVVCGAKNISVGQKVPFARLGAKLPGGRTIERAVIRGTESQGMLCSGAELGLPADEDGILVLKDDVEPGVDVTALIATEDAVLDVEVTPNRPDVLSHFGLARELAALFRLPLEKPASPDVAGDGSPLHVQVEVPEACLRYVGREILDVKVRPSPGWMARRLACVGIKPINNVVDATNFVLMELGHPLHAFDADKLEERKIRVRWAHHEETLLALDHREYVLEPDCLVIADGRRPVALAGLIGGADTAVSDKTVRVFLESACFAPVVVRRTARRFKLRTESSFRFERGVDPEAAAFASARAADLILKTAGGRSTQTSDHYPAPSRPLPIEVSWDRVRALLDTPISHDRAEERIKRLADEVERTPSGWKLTPPTHRRDLAHVADVVEEIARLDGYELIPETASPVLPALPRPHAGLELEERFRRKLSGLGFLEAYNYDFVSFEELERTGCDSKESLASVPALENPLSADWQYLRPTLAVGLLKSLQRNVNRGLEDVRLYEFGRTYAQQGHVTERASLGGVAVGSDPAELYWVGGQRHAWDFYRLKGAVRTLLAGWGEPAWTALPAGDRLFHPGESAAAYLIGKPVGRLGLLHPGVAESWDFKKRAVWLFELDLEPLLAQARTVLQYKPVPLFPAVERDLSVVFDESVSWEVVHRTVLANGRPLLKAADLADKFTGHSVAKGKRSLTLSLRFQLADRTLTEAEVAETVQRILAALQDELKGQLRT